MNNLGKIVIAVLVLAVLGVGAYLFFFRPSPPPETPAPRVNFPSASGTSPRAGSTTMNIPGQGGATLVVNDFIHVSGTAPEPYTPGQYVLADDCASEDTCSSAASVNGFRIVYDERDQSFNVLILEEPLKDSRKNAEEFLMNRLGIASGQLCTLTYTVGTILSVNGKYAGKELGFSSCPGAVILP